MKRTMICGDCWQDLRPAEYEPISTVFGGCDRCGQWAYLNRVARVEVEANPLNPYVIEGVAIAQSQRVEAIWDEVEDQAQPETQAMAEGRALLRPVMTAQHDRIVRAVEDLQATVNRKPTMLEYPGGVTLIVRRDDDGDWVATVRSRSDLIGEDYFATEADALEWGQGVAERSR